MAAASIAGISALGSLGQGLFGAKGLKTEAAQLEQQAGQYRLRASQVAHSRREEFGSALATVRSLRADRNVIEGSRAQFTREGVARRRERNNENSAVLGEKLRENRLLSTAASKRRAAPFALLQGGLGAARSIGGLL